MEIQVISDKQSTYFNRREVEFSVVSEGPTAQKGEVLKELCKKLNVNPDYAVIVGISQQFGVSRSNGTLHVYKSKEDMEKHELKYLFSRGKKVEAAQKEANSAEAKK
ncbi:MAG: hypothetical protein M1360_00095 [Candidatus Marsarchaeota archaeon]|jgi:ribosomal protein S24E|nr:hypothetical protein [Candidatus Marsarchaeota archaeon]MCL5418329.1 hypothetical protein [Candidatus Marsarchaeota archaeon]